MAILMKKQQRRRLVKLSEILASTLAPKSKSNERSLKMVAGSFYIPKYNELRPLGDDAHFICAEQGTIGVADGVSGWARKGVDPGDYARELMANSVTAILDQPEGSVDPKVVLNEAFLNTEAKGSSTACVLTLTGNILHAANVGDSGFVLIRGGKIVYKSPVQHRKFNSPYQLGNTKDSPCLAQELRISVTPGDMVVAGTDGLFDNLHDCEIEEIVKQGVDEGHMPQALAASLARLAFSTSTDNHAISPFTRAALEAGFNYRGGKPDDITVIVAFIAVPLYLM